MNPTSAPVAAVAAALGLAADHELVLFIDDLAVVLHTSTRTIERRLRAGAFRIPQLPAVDHRHRWSAAVVAEWLRTNGQHVPTVREKNPATLRLVGDQRRGSSAKGRQ